MFYVKKRIEITGAHCLKLDYPSKCNNLHGHNWVITVYCKNDVVNQDGMVVDFADIKNHIMQLDHKNLNTLFSFNPTAENIAEYLCNAILFCYRVDVVESENDEATYEKI